MRGTALAVAMICLASSCSPEAGKQDAPKPVQGEGQQALHKLDEFNRAIALKRAIHASGYQCQRIDHSAYVQEYRNLSMWAATCNDGRQWALFVGREDSVQVRDCSEMNALKLPDCKLGPPKKANS